MKQLKDSWQWCFINSCKNSTNFEQQQNENGIMHGRKCENGIIHENAVMHGSNKITAFPRKRIWHWSMVMHNSHK